MRVLAFLIQNRRFALPLHSVREVVEDVSLVTIPGARLPILGAMNLRGRILAAVDLGPWISLEKSADPSENASSEGRFFVVVDHPKASLALRVHHVENISAVQSQSAPQSHEKNGDPLSQVVTSSALLANGETASLLDVDALLEALKGENLQGSPRPDFGFRLA